MTYDEIISKVSFNTGLNEKTVNKIYRAYWRAIREYIISLPLQENISNEEFSQLRPNINIPSIGKLYVDLNRYRKIKEKLNNKK